MNYYEHHIGDYDADTAHLSWVEDMAYTRLIRLYYRKERPIPLDIGEVCRLIRAIGKDQRAAVEAVLREFFVRSDDGWRQARCDEEIARFLSGAPERKIKKANEENRLKRHREERSELFQVLQEHGKHAPWNIGINELRVMAKALHATAPATPATATQTPDPRPHTPEELFTDVNNNDSQKKRSSIAAKPEGISDAVWSDFMAIRKAKKAPLTATALAGIEREAKDAGLGLAEALALCCARGWQGFKSEWVSQAGRQSGAAPAESYAERTERMHRERVAEFIGRPAEESGADIIDVTPRIKRLEV